MFIFQIAHKAPETGAQKAAEPKAEQKKKSHKSISERQKGEKTILSLLGAGSKGNWSSLGKSKDAIVGNFKKILGKLKG